MHVSVSNMAENACVNSNTNTNDDAVALLDDDIQFIDQGETIKRQREEITLLQKTIYNLSSKTSQMELLLSSNVSLQSRINKVNLYVSITIGKMGNILTSLGLSNTAEIGVDELEKCISFLLDKWSWCSTYEDMMSLDFPMMVHKSRPFYSLRNLRPHYNEASKRISDSIEHLFNKFDTRIWGLRGDLIVFYQKYDDILSCYLITIAFLRILHVLDNDAFLLRYPATSKTVVNYEDDEEYQAAVYKANPMFLKEMVNRQKEDTVQLKLNH